MQTQYYSRSDRIRADTTNSCTSFGATSIAGSRRDANGNALEHDEVLHQTPQPTKHVEMCCVYERVDTAVEVSKETEHSKDGRCPTRSPKVSYGGRWLVCTVD